MIQLYKQRGETPLQALKRLRRQRPGLENARLSYAGRLDPMAAGMLPILVADENGRREEFLAQDKKYRFSVLFGVETDTFDLLGLPEDVQLQKAVLADKEDFSGIKNQLASIAESFVGKQTLVYPPYSSKTVDLDGEKTPLWKIARSGRLDEITLPEREVEIHELDLLTIDTLTKNYIIYYIINQIGKVEGDFRQEEVIAAWKKALAELDDSDRLPKASFRIHCSSGTYVRRIAQRIGEEVGIPATAFSILRTSVIKP